MMLEVQVLVVEQLLMKLLRRMMALVGIPLKEPVQ